MAKNPLESDIQARNADASESAKALHRAANDPEISFEELERQEFESLDRDIKSAVDKEHMAEVSEAFESAANFASEKIIAEAKESGAPIIDADHVIDTAIADIAKKIPKMADEKYLPALVRKLKTQIIESLEKQMVTEMSDLQMSDEQKRIIAALEQSIDALKETGAAEQIA
jgi:hypothetical protein